MNKYIVIRLIIIVLLINLKFFVVDFRLLGIIKDFLDDLVKEVIFIVIIIRFDEVLVVIFM